MKRLKLARRSLVKSGHGSAAAVGLVKRGFRNAARLRVGAGALLFGLFSLSAVAQPDPAQSLLAEMTPEERVGQLFLVTFRGASPPQDHSVFQLIRSGHVSGVVLRAANDNYVGGEATLPNTRELIETLQRAEREAAEDPENPAMYVPLLVGVVQEGNGPPHSDILSGLSTLPPEMALGATWDPELARQVGAVLGSELSALGFNLVLGPSLDVLDDPRQLGLGDLGVRSFGGDPYWVSVLGGAYIQGLHQGSAGRLGVIAKHFPGLGGADRPIQEEASTVRKSLTQLQQIELAPFFSVTDGLPGEDLAVADGLLTGHIRYQGFQGNIRETTRPIGLDPDAFGQLLALQPFAAWREAGGVTVSGELGSGALRRFYQSLGQSFRGHLVARDAFLAGNDLLYLSNFQSDGDPDQFTTIQSTLSFFAEKYRDDAIFAQQVDEAVLRILRFKLRLFGDFELDSVLPPAEIPETVGESAIALRVARAGATLLSPAADEIASRVGGPPQIGERIVFISDVRSHQQCSSCQPGQWVGLTALEDTILALYGTRAAGQVGAWNLSSLSMADLALFLGEVPASPPVIPLISTEEVEQVLRPADWLVFVTLKADPAVFGSNALVTLLDSRPDLVRNKRVVVFAMDVPYVLSATNVSKIDLYYALYGKTGPFIELAARLLFQELSAVGAPPVSVLGVGYDLIQATSPDPDQLITLHLPQADGTETPTAGYAVGDIVQIQTGVIRDRNGNTVPDGTPVEFVLSYQGETTTASQETTTANGVAEISVTLDRLGTLSVQAVSEPVRVSEILQLNVQEGIVTVITPTLSVTRTPEPSETPPPPTPTEATGAEPDQPVEDQPRSVGVGDLALAVPTIAVLAALGNAVVGSANGGGRRLILLILCGGLIGYNYVALELPGSPALLESLDLFAGVVLAAAGSLLAGVAGYLWLSGLIPRRQ